MSEPVQRSWVSADGLTLIADDYAPAAGAARTTVICIHGLTRNARDFDTVAPRIAAQGRRVLALDVRGRGRSAYDPTPANYNPLVYAGDVIALMTQAGLGRACFIGTSMGGLITLTLSALRPDLIAAAVLNDIGPEIAAPGLARVLGYAGRSANVKTWAEAIDYTREINGDALPDLDDAGWAIFARRVFREVEGGLRLDYDPNIAEVFKVSPTSAPADAPPDLWPLFDGLAKGRPLLLIRGKTSDILDDAVTARMVAQAPHMKLVELAGVGHAPTLDESQSATAIEAFLADAP